MIKKIMASVVVVLALGAGAAYAATQLATTDGTQVCVNDTNGLMRVDSTCREGEHMLTIGGGGDIQVTQQGPLTVGWGSMGTGKTLPLTGVTVAGKCDLVTSPPAPPGTPEIGLGRLLITSNGMTGFTSGDLYTPGSGGTIGGQSLLTIPATTANGTGVNNNIGPATIVTANGATATITFGVQVDAVNRTCTYLWQATEAPN